MIRLFAGIALPGEHRQHLTRMQSGLKNARWVAPENLHITLRFIGEVDEDIAQHLCVSLGGITSQPFDLTLKDVGTFGHSPHSVWAGVEDTPCGALSCLQSRVESVLVRVGQQPERRKFSPHVTLARFRKSDHQNRLGAYLQHHNGFVLPPFTVSGFTLFESHLSHHGAHYEPLAEFDFKDPTNPEGQPYR